MVSSEPISIERQVGAPKSHAYIPFVQHSVDTQSGVLERGCDCGCLGCGLVQAGGCRAWLRRVERAVFSDISGRNATQRGVGVVEEATVTGVVFGGDRRVVVQRQGWGNWSRHISTFDFFVGACARGSGVSRQRCNIGSAP
jgi:hypothetical protein